MPMFWPSIPANVIEFIKQQPLFFVASAPTNGEHVNLSPKGHPSRTLAVLNPNQIAYLDFTGSGAETIAHIYENGRVTMMFCSFVTAPRIIRLFCKGRVIERSDPSFRQWIDKMKDTGMRIEEPEAKLRDKIEKEAGNLGKPGKPSDIDLRSSDGVGVTGVRAIIVLDIWKAQSTCGYGVPLLMADPTGKGGALLEGPPTPPPSPPTSPQDSGSDSEKNDDAASKESEKQQAEQPKAEPRNTTDVYHPKGVKFDETWDDRATMDSWTRKKVGQGGIQAYRTKHNLVSLDGLPSMKMLRTRREGTEMIVRAWANRTFVGQLQTLLTGILLALLFMSIAVGTNMISINV